MKIEAEFKRGDVGLPGTRAAPFLLSQQVRPSAARQGERLSPEGIDRLGTLLPGAQGDALTFDTIRQAGDVAGGVLVKDGEVWAVVNRARVDHQAAVFGLNPERLAAAIAEQEVTQKYIQSEPRYAGLSKQDEEVIGEAAMLTAYSQSALRTLERSAQVSRPGDDYAGIARLTQQALGRALAETPRRPGASFLDPASALRAYDAFVTQSGGRFRNYRDLFLTFARDVLAVEDPQRFLTRFEGTMVATFQAAAKALVTGR